MKLYYFPGACSLAAHIVLQEAGADFVLEKVDLGKKKTASGEDYLSVNPKGYVPALRLNNDDILTEVGTIIQYVADQNTDSRLAPKLGTIERYHLMEWLNFIATEIHKQFSPLFNPKVSQEWKDSQLVQLGRRFDYLSTHLEGKDFLMGATYTVADAYLFTVLNWCNYLKVDLVKWPALAQYLARVGARPAVQATLKAEGLAR